MSEDDAFDAGAAAARATGADVQEGASAATESHAAAEGTEASADVGSTSSLREMLLSTSPSQPLEQVEDPWDPDRGGTTRIMRGFQKMLQFDALPAFAELVIGLIETIVQVKDDLPRGGSSSGGDQEGDEDDDFDESRVPFDVEGA